MNTSFVCNIAEADRIPKAGMQEVLGLREPARCVSFDLFEVDQRHQEFEGLRLNVGLNPWAAMKNTGEEAQGSKTNPGVMKDMVFP
jgi:hypothetical protein